jgi:hypothetical protein
MRIWNPIAVLIELWERLWTEHIVPNESAIKLEWLLNSV